MKTALQEFIDNVIPMHIIELDMIKQEIKNALEIEKEQIICSYIANRYVNAGGYPTRRDEAQEYYNQTYNN